MSSPDASASSPVASSPSNAPASPLSPSSPVVAAGSPMSASYTPVHRGSVKDSPFLKKIDTPSTPASISENGPAKEEKKIGKLNVAMFNAAPPAANPPSEEKEKRQPGKLTMKMNIPIITPIGYKPPTIKKEETKENAETAPAAAEAAPAEAAKPESEASSDAPAPAAAAAVEAEKAEDKPAAAAEPEKEKEKEKEPAAAEADPTSTTSSSSGADEKEPNSASSVASTGSAAGEAKKVPGKLQFNAEMFKIRSPEEIKAAAEAKEEKDKEKPAAEVVHAAKPKSKKTQRASVKIRKDSASFKDFSQNVKVQLKVLEKKVNEEITLVDSSGEKVAPVTLTAHVDAAEEEERKKREEEKRLKEEEEKKNAPEANPDDPVVLPNGAVLPAPAPEIDTTGMSQQELEVHKAAFAAYYEPEVILPFDEKKADFYMTMLLAGNKFLKHGRSGSPHSRLVYMDENYMLFVVDGTKKVKSTDAKNMLNLLTLDKITKGKETAVFKRSTAEKSLDTRCFTLAGAEREFNFEAPSGALRDDWFEAINYIHYTHGKMKKQ